ncbi:DctP family TRAP transporter solute-binding subunit [Bacillus marinisedimentorum]|uniref:TRAP transporter substrate-binding protein n=1 Tax=Bacillus marinisedimentorum TaxID=1821260 RepID=UPI0007DE7822|nr:DctP family TRAP transporter solute-binding subunit [Bacillus marinisedimentorum]
MFKKKSILVIAIMMVVSMVLAACGGGNAEEGNAEGGSDGEMESYNWRFVTEELDGQLQYEYAEEFAKRMKEKSDGKITIDVYEFGGLGSEVDQVEQLQNGAVQFAIMSPGFTGGMVKEGQLFALHFLFPDDLEKTQEILNTSEALNTDLTKKYEEHNITPLAYWTEGAMQWTSDKPITKPEDFKNFKMRTQTSPLILESYKAYGANPTPMSWGELYTALDRGTVQGQENPIFFIEDASFHEVQDHMTISNHNNYVAMTTVNTDWFKGLPDDVKALVTETVDEMRDWTFDLQTEMNKEMLTKIKENEEHPTEIHELTEEQREAFREEAKSVRDFYINEVSTVDGAILEKLMGEME